jgi:hypothetical protein
VTAHDDAMPDDIADAVAEGTDREDEPCPRCFMPPPSSYDWEDDK